MGKPANDSMPPGDSVSIHCPECKTGVGIPRVENIEWECSKETCPAVFYWKKGELYNRHTGQQVFDQMKKPIKLA